MQMLIFVYPNNITREDFLPGANITEKEESLIDLKVCLVHIRLSLSFLVKYIDFTKVYNKSIVYHVPVIVVITPLSNFSQK